MSLRVQVTKAQVDAVFSFCAAYPKYKKEDILEIAATPHFVPQMYKEAHGLKVVSLNELALILNGHYDIVDAVQDALDNNPVLSSIASDIEKCLCGDDVKAAAVDSLRVQTAKGIEKYGAAVDFNSLSAVEWLQHEIEEATDGLVYKHALLMKLKGENDANTKMCWKCNSAEANPGLDVCGPCYHESIFGKGDTKCLHGGDDQ